MTSRLPDICVHKQRANPGHAAIALLVVTLALWPLGPLNALGFSELEQHSALGQPVDLSLRVSGLSEDFDPRRIRIASPATYAELGLERPKVFEGARIEVMGEGSEARIRIRSRERALDPMMTLVLEGVDPHGVVRREYTLLLDPPGSAEAILAPKPAAGNAPRYVQAEPITESAVVDSSAERPTARQNAPAAPASNRKLRPPSVEALASSASSRAITAPAGGAVSQLRTPRSQSAAIIRPTGEPGGQASISPRAGSTAKPLSKFRFQGRQQPLNLQLLTELQDPSPKFAARAATTMRPSQALSERSLAQLRVITLPAGKSLAPEVQGAAPSEASNAANSERVLGVAKKLIYWLLGAALMCFLLLLILLGKRSEKRPDTKPRPSKTVRPVEIKKQKAQDSIPPAMPMATPLPPAAAAARTLALSDIQTPPVPDREPIPKAVLRDLSAIEVIDPTEESFGEQTHVVQALQNSLRYSPNRMDLRLKLLEVCHDERNVDSFVENAEVYASKLGDHANHQWPKVLAMGRELAPTHLLFKDDQPVLNPSLRRFYDALPAESLTAELNAFSDHYRQMSSNTVFSRVLSKMYLRDIERPTMLTHAQRLTKEVGGAQILIKREDLRAPRESQRINAYGQALLASHLDKKLIVSATNNGLHGEAIARAAYSVELPVRIFLPQKLLQDQSHPSIRLMRLLDAEIIAIAERDPREAAMADWLRAPKERYYASGLDAGPAPYPAIVVDMQGVIGEEVRQQTASLSPEGVHACIAPRAAGAAGVGLLHAMMSNDDTALYCVETGGAVIVGEHPNNFSREHRQLRGSGRVKYCSLAMAEVYNAAKLGSRLEGFPEDACNAATLAQTIKIAASLPKSHVVVGLFVNAMETASAQVVKSNDPDPKMLM